MFQTIRQKALFKRKDYDAVLLGDFPTIPEGMADKPEIVERIAKKEAKIKAAKEYLGPKWIAHPANRVTKKMDDAANDERQALIAGVK